MNVHAPVERPRTPPGWLLLVAVLVLFTVWSNSFIAIEYLLKTPDPGSLDYDWVSLTAARFVPVLLICLPWVLIQWPRRSLGIVRQHWKRLLIGSLFNVSGYSFALYYAQSAGVASPIASLMTAFAPLFLMLLAAVFLSERLTLPKLVGFGISFIGVVIISTSKEMEGAAYPLLIAIAACAPLSWAIYSVITKPLTREVPPLLLTLLVLCFGSLPYVFVLPFAGWEETMSLQVGGWASLLFLSVLSTVFGFWLWTWLLKYLPASVIGFTIFLNPPMTTAYKALLSAFMPERFDFTIVPGEVIGGVIAMAGVAWVVWRRSRTKRPA